MKRKLLAFVLATGVAFASSAIVNEVNDFWDTSEYASFTPVPQSSASSEEVSGFTSTSVWKAMAEAFDTFVQGLMLMVK